MVMDTNEAIKNVTGILTAIKKDETVSEDLDCTAVCAIQEGTAYSNNYNAKKMGNT